METNPKQKHRQTQRKNSERWPKRVPHNKEVYEKMTAVTGQTADIMQNCCLERPKGHKITIIVDSV